MRKISQNIYLDLSELDEILYLGSRDVYLSNIQTVLGLIKLKLVNNMILYIE